jgi:hypothetical protein
MNAETRNASSNTIMKLSIDRLPLAVALVGAALVVYAWPLAPDFDLYLHLKTGEWIWNHHNVPVTDPFLYGNTSHNELHSWLGQLIFFLVHRAGGEMGLRLLNLGVLWSVLLIGFRYANRLTNARVAGIAACLLLVAHRTTQEIRPLLFGELAFAILVFGLLEKPTWLSVRRLAAIVALIVLWVNLHGSALISIPILTLYAIDLFFARQRLETVSRSRQLMSYAAPGFAVLACLVNPMGARLFKMTWELSRIGKISGFVEWGSGLPFTLEPHLPPPDHLKLFTDSRSLLLYAGALLGLKLLTDADCRKKRFVELTLSFFFLALAFSAIRHALFLIYPAIVLSALAAERYLIPRRTGARWFQAASLAFPALLLVSAHVVRTGYVTPSINRAVDFMEEAGLSGNVLNYQTWGSYLSYRLYPKLRAACDSRLYVNRAYYEFQNQESEEFGGMRISRLIEHFPDSDFVMLRSDIPLRELLPAGRWLVIYQNNEAILALNREARNQENLRRVQTYYQRHGVDFSPTEGFSLARAHRSAPTWVESNLEGVAWGKWVEPEWESSWQEKRRHFLETVKGPVG